MMQHHGVLIATSAGRLHINLTTTAPVSFANIAPRRFRKKFTDRAAPPATKRSTAAPSGGSSDKGTPTPATPSSGGDGSGKQNTTRFLINHSRSLCSAMCDSPTHVIAYLLASFIHWHSPHSSPARTLTPPHKLVFIRSSVSLFTIQLFDLSSKISHLSRTNPGLTPSRTPTLAMQADSHGTRM
jgi:hypothetical protein